MNEQRPCNGSGYVEIDDINWPCGGCENCLIWWGEFNDDGCEQCIQVTPF